ncbi:MAG TPA: ABC transporter ATP-binding protein [Thermoplasmata archaeon]|nr:ABC transporter ATP-binding protein [Thermoplasmata archaeon]
MGAGRVVLLTDLEVAGVTAQRGQFRLGPVSFRIPAGSATVLLGPSGAGKTTLLRTVAGFLPALDGEVRVDGTRVDGLPPEARRFGFVPPNLGLFPQRRARWNVRYPLALRGDPDADEKADAWVRRFGLAMLADRYPHELSSGQRQRVAMARALAAEPRALLWDEPLAALDLESRDTLVRLLRDLLETERIPLLLVTHDPSTAFALASRLVVLDRGRLVADRAPEELAAGPLDRFLARFLGYENLYAREEVEGAAGLSLGSLLSRRLGPGGLAVPPSAVRLRGRAEGAHEVHVTALTWTAAGWAVALRQGPLTVHASVPAGPPGVRVGDVVTVDVDDAQVKPLEDLGWGGAP